mmetsp:Transcript_6907/g.16993  ORF Transcript_6907/g.16993 Transcript_6907/m.16993 type:complete len:276 (+) Transcript_6907:37-864(+)
MGRGRRRPPLRSVLQFEVSGDDPWGQEEEWTAPAQGGYRNSKVTIANASDLPYSELLDSLKLAKCGHSRSAPSLRHGDLQPLSRLRRVGPTWHGVIESERSPALGPMRARLQEKFTLAWQPPPGAHPASDAASRSPDVAEDASQSTGVGGAGSAALALPLDGEEESVEGDMLVRSPTVRVERRSASPQGAQPKVTLQVSPPRTPAPPAPGLEDWQLPLPPLDHPGSLVLHVVGLGGSNTAHLSRVKAADRGASAAGPRPGGAGPTGGPLAQGGGG